MLLNLKPGIVYGPVNSRRLGRSLGINVLPHGAKLCSFNCAYCQYGWTDSRALDDLPALSFPTVDEVVDAVEKALRALASPPAYLTFSGNGEPTLHPSFPQLVDALVAVRNRIAPQARTAILSNSTRVADPIVRAALARLDDRIMKLDAGDDATLRRFNEPLVDLDIDSIVEGLRTLGEVTIQALFAGGTGGNAGPDEIAAWIDQVVTVQPSAVQIYTLARGYPSGDIRPLENEELRVIAAGLVSHGPVATVY